jgi:FixJ family two-component response regulator
VVDDDASFRTAIERRLKHAGYEVETYSSAQHLLDRPPGVEKPGCILTQMPGLNGPNCKTASSNSADPARRVRHRHSDISTTVRHQGGG